MERKLGSSAEAASAAAACAGGGLRQRLPAEWRERRLQIEFQRWENENINTPA